MINLCSDVESLTVERIKRCEEPCSWTTRTRHKNVENSLEIYPGNYVKYSQRTNRFSIMRSVSSFQKPSADNFCTHRINDRKQITL